MPTRSRFFIVLARVLHGRAGIPSLLATLFLASSAYAGPGDLDPRFGELGAIGVDLEGRIDSGFSIAVQPDDAIVVAGRTVSGGDQNFAVVRLDADGAPDPTFGTAGVIRDDLPGAGEVGWAVALQADGKILVAGEARGASNQDFAVVRYRDDGTRDPDFGTAGLVTTNLGTGADQAQAVVVLEDESILVAGWGAFAGTGADFAVVRHLSDGTLDASFGVGGVARVDFAGGFDVLQSMIVQSDGAILLAGCVDCVTAAADFGVARLLANGTLDPSFGSGGKVRTDFGGGFDGAVEVLVRSDGGIVAAGCANCLTGSDDVAVVRYAANGSLDPSFGVGGKAIVDLHGLVRGAALEDDGRILVVAEATNRLGIVRFGSDGVPDPLFGDAGVALLSLTTGSSSGGYAVTTQSDGRAVVAGSLTVASAQDIGVYRILNDDACGDEIEQGGEECDDGNRKNSDACRNDCAHNVCGDGFVLVGVEQCDDRGQAPGDGCDASCLLEPGMASGTVAAGGTVTTDALGAGPTASTPIHASVTAFAPATITITRESPPASPSGFTLLGGFFEIDIAPAGPGPQLYEIRFGLDATLIPTLPPQGLVIFKDGAIVPTCSGPFATPDPCVSSRSIDLVGDATVVVYSTSASDWGAAASVCAFATAGTPCRSAAADCDAVEVCDGVTSECPADAALPDADGDLLCDVVDPCTNVGGERDFLLVPPSQLLAIGVGTDPVVGNDKLIVNGSFELPASTLFGDLDPLANGARVLVVSAAGQVRIDASLPGGAFGGRGTRGWKSNGSGSRWTYVDRTAAPIAGIGSVKLGDRGSSVLVSVRGKRGIYPIEPGDEPVQMTIVLGDQAAAARGECGESAFTAADCGFNGAGDRLRCKLP